MFGELWKWEDTDIKGITDNSQRIKSGYVFVCMTDDERGYFYAQEAVKKGAVAVISESDMDLSAPLIKASDVKAIAAYLAKKFYFPKEKNFKLIGVTGTNGKTTVTHLIKDILELGEKKVGMIGTNGIFIRGRKTNLYKSTPTTPNALELWQIFSVMQKEGIEYIVMEVSSHALALERVTGCEFDVGVFTNLTRDHLDFHKTMEEYKKAKTKLFAMTDTAVINIDDTIGAGIFGNIKCKKLSVGFNDADVVVNAVSMHEGGSEFFIEYNKKIQKVNFGLPGKFNIYNALSAAGACLALGFDLEAVVLGLEAAKPVKGRMEQIITGKDFAVIIDYAHTPDGLEKVIHTAKGFAGGRVITVFGCGGDRDKSKRSVMGDISGRFSDYTIITSDNPRTESELAIIEDIYNGIKKTSGKFDIVPDRKMAIGHAIDMAKPGDVILLAGKGQEDYQILGKEKIHFDEREIVRQYLVGAE